MANNYLLFSEVIPRLSPEEEQWLNEQLAVIYVLDGKEYDEDQLPEGQDPDAAEYHGCRAFRDMEEDDSAWDELPGFEYSFGTDEEEDPQGWGRHLWIYAEEGGVLTRVAHLVQEFLKTFRPKECWSVTYSETCSKPRVGEFGGGAIFVTASEIKWQSSYQFIDNERRAFAGRASST